MRTTLVAVAISLGHCGCVESDSTATPRSLSSSLAAEANNAKVEVAIDRDQEAIGIEATMAPERLGDIRWKTATSTKHGFSIEFPGDFSEHTFGGDDEAQELEINMLIHSQREGYS